MQIFVFTPPTGVPEVEPCSLVGEVKAQLEKQEGISLALCSLAYFGVQLDERQTLADYGVPKEALLYLARSATGGGIKGGAKSLFNSTFSKLPAKDLRPGFVNADRIYFEMYGYLHSLFRANLSGQPMAVKDFARHLVLGDKYVDTDRVNEMAELAVEYADKFLKLVCSPSARKRLQRPSGHQQ
jgi:hypothetical protein